jgi:hypothetical protein
MTKARANKKPVNCANNPQAVNQIKQSHSTLISQRLKLEFLRIAAWLSIAGGA